MISRGQLEVYINYTVQDNEEYPYLIDRVIIGDEDLTSLIHDDDDFFELIYDLIERKAVILDYEIDYEWDQSEDGYSINIESVLFNTTNVTTLARMDYFLSRLVKSLTA